MCVVCVCRFGVVFTYVIEGIDSKVISVCLVNDYSLIADLHIFVYERAECTSLSFECTEVKLLILNNFDIKIYKNIFKLFGAIIYNNFALSRKKEPNQ